MTTVSRSNIVNTLPLFIRDVLRNKLVDKQSPVRVGTAWIFKGAVQEDFDPPTIFIGEIRVNERTMNVQKSKRFPIEAIMITRVFADKMKNRDDLVNETRETLHDYDNTDGTNSIKSQQLSLDSFRSRLLDTLDSEPVKIKRVGEMTMVWGYSGA